MQFDQKLIMGQLEHLADESEFDANKYKEGDSRRDLMKLKGEIFRNLAALFHNQCDPEPIDSTLDELKSYVDAAGLAWHRPGYVGFQYQKAEWENAHATLYVQSSLGRLYASLYYKGGEPECEYATSYVDCLRLYRKYIETLVR